MTPARVAINGRFLTMVPTGVQRYAREILPHLAELLGNRLAVLVPPDRIVLGEKAIVEKLLDEAPVRRWHGVNGHRWEQLALPRLFRRAGAAALWSPCDWGPLEVRSQLVTVHDIGPLTQPQLFTPTYRLLARALTRPLVTRSAMVSTTTAELAQQLTAVLGVDPSRVAVVPPGVGEPFASWPLDDLDSRPRRWCVFIGLHDSRKNGRFLLDLWPDVHRRTGLELHVTRRSLTTTRKADPHPQEVPSVVEHVDPTDAELAELYAGSLCLLWPSLYEGYGLPLLEAMATGTPFLSTNVGAAAELAIDPEQQLLPLDPTAWVARLEEWANGAAGPLRRPSAARARSLTWRQSAEQTAAVLVKLADS